MIVINDDRKVITHHGVKGMKWGIRKDNYAANRSKAKRVVQNYKQSNTINRGDLRDAEWMSKSITGKLKTVVATQVAGQILTACYKGKVPTTPYEIKKTLTEIGKRAAIHALKNEISGQGALKRYTDEGKKDSSKKQYKKKAITPNRLIANLAVIGVYAAPTIANVGKLSYNFAKVNRAVNQERVDKWGQNLLPKPGKTSEWHTIYDNGYMSILERIRP